MSLAAIEAAGMSSRPWERMSRQLHVGTKVVLGLHFRLCWASTSGLGSGAQVETCLNKSVLTAIADSTVVCAGAIVGGRRAIRAYLALVLDVGHLTARESCMTEASSLLVSEARAACCCESTLPSSSEPEVVRCSHSRASPPTWAPLGRLYMRP